MIRHEALHPFSRDHSVGLVLARKLMRDEAADELVQAWDLELNAHFRQEEELLGPLIRDFDVAQRFLEDHRVFEGYVNSIRHGDRGRPVQIAAGQLLDAHIHWEERVMFAHIEKVSTDEEMEDLQRRTEEVEQQRWDSPLEPRRRRIVTNRLNRQAGRP